jgi:hypothetical protein
MAKLPGSTPVGAHLIVRQGNKLLAHTRGLRDPVDITHPGVHHLIATDAHFQDGPKGEMVPIHQAYHTNPKSLPPALLKLIEEAVRNYLETQDLHGGMAPKAAPMMGAPPPPPAGLPGSMAA